MADPRGGPISGGMEAQQGFARQTIEENQAARPQSVQPRQETPQKSETVEQYNDRIAERNASDRAGQLGHGKQKQTLEAKQELANSLAPKEASGQEKSQVQQKQPQPGKDH